MTKQSVASADSYLYEGEERPEVYEFPKKQDHISIGVIIRHAVNLFAWNFKEIAQIYLAFGLVASVANWLLFPVLMQGIPEILGVHSFLRLLLNMLIKILPGSILSSPATIAYFLLVRSRITGEALGVRHILIKSMRLLPGFLLPVLIFAVGAVAAMFLFPLLWLSLILSVYILLYQPAFVLGERGPLSCFRYSITLVRGSWWRVVGMTIVASLITLPISIPGMLVDHTSWLHLLFSAIFGPGYAITAIMYAFLFKNSELVHERRLRIAALKAP